MRIGIIGLGRIAMAMQDEWKTSAPRTHLQVWQALGVDVVAGCDLDAEKQQDFLARCPDAIVYGDYRQMLKNEKLDIVSICAYATTRCEMIEAACAAGVRGIWCEKAMAVSLAECERIERAVNRAGDIPVSISYIRRWSPKWRLARHLLEEGAIGSLESLNLHFSGNMIHTGTHGLDVLRMLAGEVKTVRAWLDRDATRSEQSGYRFGGDETLADYSGFALLEFESGVKAAIHGADKGYFRFELEILGSHGMIRVGNTQRELWQVAESAYIHGFDELMKVDWPGQLPGDAWIDLARELLTAVESGIPVCCGPDEGRAALAVALAMHESDVRGHVAFHPVDVDPQLVVESR